jgi:hypothetical protein
MGNTRLNDVVDGHVPDDARLPFLCECADEACNGRVEIARSDWQDVVAHTNQFVMVAGHLRSEGELVVGAIDGYDVVRKPD